MTGPRRAAQTLKFLSRRALEELRALQASVHELSLLRGSALRMLLASRHAATAVAQRDFWLEFVWADQEYRPRSASHTARSRGEGARLERSAGWSRAAEPVTRCDRRRRNHLQSAQALSAQS